MSGRGSVHGYLTRARACEDAIRRADREQHGDRVGAVGPRGQAAMRVQHAGEMGAAMSFMRRKCAMRKFVSKKYLGEGYLFRRTSAPCSRRASRPPATRHARSARDTRECRLSAPRATAGSRPRPLPPHAHSHDHWHQWYSRSNHGVRATRRIRARRTGECAGAAAVRSA